MAWVIEQTLFSKFFLISIVTIIFLGIGFNDAYAGGTVSLTEFTADDPDNDDKVFSAGDTFNISFNMATNQSGIVTQANILGNFTFDTNPGNTFRGVWTDNQNLLVTVISSGATPTLGIDTVDMLGTNTIGRFVPHPPGENADAGAVVLFGDYGFGNGGGVPSGGFQSPTMGVTRYGEVFVEDGFSYNNNPVDAALMNTHYPMVTTKVGEENVAKLKIFTPRGIDRLQHAAVAFGLDKHQIFGESNVVLEWDKLPNGEETLTVIDPENYLADVRVVTSEGKCRTNGNDQCKIIEFYHIFRKPLDYNIIGTYIWDNNRSGWQNYYNDGIEIVGDSPDPPAKHQVIHKGKKIQISEIGKNIALDQEGNLWTFEKYWKIEYQPIEKIDDGISSKGIERNNVRFNTYLEGQILLAEHLLETSVDGSMIKSKDVGKSKSYDYDITTRSNDIQLQNRIAYELERANDLFTNRFVVNEDNEFQKYWKIYKQFLEKNS